MSARTIIYSIAAAGLLVPLTVQAQTPQEAPIPAPQTLEQPMAQPGAEEAAGDIQALTRGPLHEAFAEPVSVDPATSVAVPQQPPEPIEELPPEARPDDPNAVWIPGYWIWSDEQNDFLWVSGIWRVAPSNMRWVPGYWTRADGGFHRVSGFWTPVVNQEVTYLPEPPESLDQGPTMPAPSADHFWVPGCWIWQTDHYVWRAGYWARIQPDWVWVPDHYVRTPHGCVLVHGFWDWPVARRGVLFAPVYFARQVYREPDFVYTPSVLIDVQFVTNHCFVRPDHGHYYYGDYYDARYQQAGFVPWYAFHGTRGWYDPIFVHLRSVHGPDWGNQLVASFRYFSTHSDLRPRHTFAQQQRFLDRLAARDDVDRTLVQRISAGTTLREALEGRTRFAQRLEPLPESQRREIRQHVAQLRDLTRERLRTEAQAGVRVDRLQPEQRGRALGSLRLPAFDDRVDRGPLTDRQERIGRRTDERRFDGRSEDAQRREALRPDLDGQLQPGAGRSEFDDTQRRPLDRGPTDRRDMDRGPLDRAPMDRQPGDRRALDRDTDDRRPTDQPEVQQRSYGYEQPQPERPSAREPDYQSPGSRIPGLREMPDRTRRPTEPAPQEDRIGPFPERQLAPDADEARTAIPGGERPPDRIPGGIPGIGPSQTPSGQGLGPRPGRIPDLNDRRLPSTAPGIPGTGPGVRRPEQLPQFPQSGGSARQPQTMGERQPLRQPQTNANRMTLPGPRGNTTIPNPPSATREDFRPPESLRRPELEARRLRGPQVSPQPGPSRPGPSMSPGAGRPGPSASPGAGRREMGPAQSPGPRGGGRSPAASPGGGNPGRGNPGGGNPSRGNPGGGNPGGGNPGRGNK